MERLERRTLLSSYTAASAGELIAAVNAANASDGADTITLAVGAIFSLTAVNNTTTDATGLPTIAADSGGLTIVGNGGTIERSAADGTLAFRLFDVAAGAALTLKDLTLQGGLARSWAQGGAIISQGTLVLESVTVQNNTARGYDAQTGSWAFGGGASGGAIYSGGALTMLGCTIRNNVALGGRGADAGPGVRTTPGSTTNISPGGSGGGASGGGVYVAGGTATISNCTLSGNTAQGGDGGRAYSKPYRHGGNGGGAFGGGIYVAGGSVTLRNSTTTANSALGGRPGRDAIKGSGIGGGIYINSAASVGLDAFTAKNTTRNTASTSDGNIAGLYEVIT